MRRQTLLNWEPVDEDVVPPVPGHLLHLGVHLKHLQISITISITNIIIDDASVHLASNILDLGSETCNLSNRVGDFSRRQVLNNLKSC